MLNEKIKIEYLYSKRHLNQLPNFFSKESATPGHKKKPDESRAHLIGDGWQDILK